MGSQNRYEGFDRFAIAVLRRKARKLARHLKLDPSDIEQELAVDLHLRLRQYDPSRLSKNTFVSHIINHKVSLILEREHAQMRDSDREERSLDDPLPDQVDGQKTRFGDTLDSELGRAGLSRQDLSQLKADLAVAAADLSERQRRLVELLLEEPNVRRAARKLRVHHTTVYQDIRQIHERFEKVGLQEYLKKRPTPRGRRRY